MTATEASVTTPSDDERADEDPLHNSLPATGFDRGQLGAAAGSLYVHRQQQQQQQQSRKKSDSAAKNRIFRLFARRWSAELPRRDAAAAVAAVANASGSCSSTMPLPRVSAASKERRSHSMFTAGAFVKPGSVSGANSLSATGCLLERSVSHDPTVSAARAGTGGSSSSGSSIAGGARIGASVEGCHEAAAHVTLQGGRSSSSSSRHHEAKPGYRRSKSDNALSRLVCNNGSSGTLQHMVASGDTPTDLSSGLRALSPAPMSNRMRRHSGTAGPSPTFSLGDGSEHDSGGSDDSRVCADFASHYLALCAACRCEGLPIDDGGLGASREQLSADTTGGMLQSSKQMQKSHESLALVCKESDDDLRLTFSSPSVSPGGDYGGGGGGGLSPPGGCGFVKYAAQHQLGMKRQLSRCSSCGSPSESSAVKKDNFVVRFEVTKETENIFLPALKGVSLGEALDALLKQRRLLASDISAYLDFSCTALSLSSDTFHLGGASLRITGRDEAPRRHFSNLGMSASMKAPRTQDVWSNGEMPFRKSSAPSSISKAVSVVGRTLSSASLPSNARRSTSWHSEKLSADAAAAHVLGLPPLAVRLSEGYSEEVEMATPSGSGSSGAGGGSSAGSSMLSKRRLTAVASAAYPGSPSGDGEAAVPDVSPSNTISRSSRASHRIASSFFSHGAKERDKGERLSACLDGWSVSGLPAMPELYAMCQPRQCASVLDMEEHWTTIVDNADLSQKQKDLQEALWELLYTEAEYNRSLNVINDLFVCCLLNLQSEQLLNEIDVDQLFSNIADIIRTNASFWDSHMLPLLQSARSSHCQLDVRKLKPAFSKFSETFYAYMKYCLDHASCSMYMKKAEKESELFRTFVAWAEAQKQCNRLKLHDLLVKPMQRLTRYSLLLRAVAKKADEDDVKADLLQMVDNVDRFVKQVNRALHQKHEADKLRSLATRIEAYDVFDMPYNDSDLTKLLALHANFDLQTPIPGCGGYLRHLLHEGPLKMKDSNTKQDVYCFVFTDLFLITKASKRVDKVKIIKAPMMVDRLIVEEHSKDGNPYLLLLHMCEYGVAQAAYAFHGDNISKWSEMIGRAQDVLAKVKASRLEEQLAADKRFTVDDAEVDVDVSFVVPSLRRVSSSASNLDGLTAELAASADSLSSCGTDADDSSAAAAAAAASSPRQQQQPLLQKRAHSDANLAVPDGSASISDESGFTRGRSPGPCCGGDRRPTSLLVPGSLAEVIVNGGCSLAAAASSVQAISAAKSPCLAGSAAALALLPGSTAQDCCSTDALAGGCHGCADQIGACSVFRASADTLLAEDCQGSLRSLADTSNSESRAAQCGAFTCAGSSGNRRRAGYERRYRTADAIEEMRSGGGKDVAIHKRLSWNLGSATTGGDDRGFPRKSSRALSSDSVRSSTSGVSSTNSVMHTSVEDAQDIYEEGEEEENVEEEDADSEENADRELEQFEFHQSADGKPESHQWQPQQIDGVAVVHEDWQMMLNGQPGHMVLTANTSREVDYCTRDDVNNDDREARLRIEEAEEAAVLNTRNTPSMLSHDQGRDNWHSRQGVHSASDGTAGVISAGSRRRPPLPQGCTATASAGANRRLTQAELVRMRNRLLLSAHDAAEV